MEIKFWVKVGSTDPLPPPPSPRPPPPSPPPPPPTHTHLSPVKPPCSGVWWIIMVYFHLMVIFPFQNSSGHSSAELVYVTLSAPNFKRHLRSAFLFQQISLEKKFIRKVERLNIKQRRYRWDGSYEPSHLDLCCLQILLLSPVAVKELNVFYFITSTCDTRINSSKKGRD